MGNCDLIRKTGSGDVALSYDDWEPAFFDCGGKLYLDLDSPQRRQRYLDYLSHCISRRPSDLAARVRCVLLACSAGQAEIVFEGLHALFTLLAEKGDGLRMRLLQAGAPWLTPEQSRLLAALSERKAGEPEVPRIVEKLETGEPDIPVFADEDVLLEVSDYLENGQTELAQAALERALRVDQDNALLTSMLLDIFRRSKDRARLVKLREELSAMNEQTARLWDEVASELAGAA